MDVVADLPADAQAAEPVQQAEGLLDHPPIDTHAGAVRCGDQMVLRAGAGKVDRARFGFGPPLNARI